jgi:fructose-bisphosphate aldolase class II
MDCKKRLAGFYPLAHQLFTMLSNLKELLHLAEKGSYAIGAFNVQNLEFARGIIDAAQEHPSPLIMQISSRTLHFFGINEILQPCLSMARDCPVPICLHLDHARDLALIRSAVEAGFTSVMYDGSSLPLDENIQKSQLVVDLCRGKQISVEAEVGVVGNDEDDPSKAIRLQYSSEEEVKRFCTEVTVDALAVSLGSIHGMKKASASLDLNLLQRLADIAQIPLVVHGSSGVLDADLQNAIQHGIRKINVATKLKYAAGQAIYELSRLQGVDGLSDSMSLSIRVRQAVKEAVLDRLAIFNPHKII